MMGLKPLEFEDCILDSPYFRENIHEHEREIERTNEAIKGLIKECRTVLKAIESKYCYYAEEKQLIDLVQTFRAAVNSHVDV